MSLSSSRRADGLAVLFLVGVWLVFFWRIFTPTTVDQVSFAEGDYFGQFVTFGAYQYQRLSNGEIPLWNPYNNGGLPFIADTQAVALYPPRLLSIAWANISGQGWTYGTLQTESAFHVLLYTLTLYIFVRRLTRGQRGTHVAGVIAAVSAGYGGFMTSYPLLQTAVLESVTWIPLMLLGVLEATRNERLRLSWAAFAGFALGLSWMAGHPQSAWFATYFGVAYLGWRIWDRADRWRVWALGTAIIGAVTFGVTAIHLLPGAEYLMRTMRTGLGFDEKGNGFIIRDVTMFLYPTPFWSPLYFGAVSFGLAALGLTGRGRRERWFWLGVFVVALASSFGANGAAFHAFYNILPGMSFFRGQERAVVILTQAAAVLVAFGVLRLYAEKTADEIRMIQTSWRGFGAFCAAVAVILFALSFNAPDDYGHIVDQAFLTALVVGIAAFLIWRYTIQPQARLMILLAVLIAFELLTVNIGRVVDPIPPGQRDVMRPSSLVQTVQADDEPAFRVDGGMVQRIIGIPPGGNTGSLFNVRDIRGISPLFLDGAHAIIQRESPAPVAWEVFAVKYVFSESDSLPVEANAIESGVFLGEPVYLHQLEDPRPFAHLVYDYEVIDGDGFARQLLADPRFDARETVILNEAPSITPAGTRPDDSTATVIDYTSERFTIETASTEAAILSVAHVDYPGWRVTVNGERVTPIRAYGAVVAIPLPAGEHIVEFHYAPTSFIIGASLSLVTWAGLAILGLWYVLRRRKD